MVTRATTITAKPFGRWLLDQQNRSGIVGELALAAKRDPIFPADGDFETIARHLSARGAEPDMHEALEMAELDWAAI